MTQQMHEETRQLIEKWHKKEAKILRIELMFLLLIVAGLIFITALQYVTADKASNNTTEIKNFLYCLNEQEPAKRTVEFTRFCADKYLSNYDKEAIK